MFFLGNADVLLPWNVSVNLHWQHKITHKNSFKLLHLDFNEHFWIKPFKNTFAQRYIKWTHFNDFLSLRIYAVQCKKTHTLLQKNNAYFECKQTPRPKFIGLRNRNAEHYNMKLTRDATRQMPHLTIPTEHFASLFHWNWYLLFSPL